MFRYKTEFCRTYHLQGTCPYGVRCRFIHEIRDEPSSQHSALQQAHSLQFNTPSTLDGFLYGASPVSSSGIPGTSPAQQSQQQQQQQQQQHSAGPQSAGAASTGSPFSTGAAGSAATFSSPYPDFLSTPNPVYTSPLKAVDARLVPVSLDFSDVQPGLYQGSTVTHSANGTASVVVVATQNRLSHPSRLSTSALDHHSETASQRRSVSSSSVSAEEERTSFDGSGNRRLSVGSERKNSVERSKGRLQVFQTLVEEEDSAGAAVVPGESPARPSRRDSSGGINGSSVTLRERSSIASETGDDRSTLGNTAASSSSISASSASLPPFSMSTTLSSSAAPSSNSSSQQQPLHHPSTTSSSVLLSASALATGAAFSASAATATAAPAAAAASMTATAAHFAFSASDNDRFGGTFPNNEDVARAFEPSALTLMRAKAFETTTSTASSDRQFRDYDQETRSKIKIAIKDDEEFDGMDGEIVDLPSIWFQSPTLPAATN
jgi:hypothetical protein